jgi:DEAD/DEAH box helicase domain-containing protein
MVASSAPLDQFIVRNPQYFFGASPERALIDPDNLHILVDHIKCATFELPFTSDETFGRHDVQEILALLAEQGLVHRASEDAPWTWTNESYPADAVSLRSVSSDNFVIVDTTGDARVIGETDFTSGPGTLHPKAIYMIEGQLYQVEKLDFEGRKAFVKSIDCDYYTTAITYTKVTVIDTFAVDDGAEHAWDDGAKQAPPLRESEGDAVGAELARPDARDGNEDFVGAQRARHEHRQPGVRSHGEVHVVSRVVGFKKIKFYTNENIGSGELDLPEQQMHTTAYWLTIPAEVMGMLPYASDDRRDGVVGLAFALRQVAQLLLMCDGHDIGISIAGFGIWGSGFASPADQPSSESPTPNPDGVRVFVYDNYPGGIGFSAPLFGLHAELLGSTRRLISECDCESGCPGCVGPIGHTGPLAKVAALRILDLLLDHAHEIDARRNAASLESEAQPF